MDEMWSDEESKKNQRWLWHAIDHATRDILPYGLGDRLDVVFFKLKALRAPFGITRFVTDDWGACERHLAAEQHVVGKRNTQDIEHNHLTLRTRIKRLARKTICLSKLSKLPSRLIYSFRCQYPRTDGPFSKGLFARVKMLAKRSGHEIVQRTLGIMCL